jgi:hypothetical protein
MKFSSPLLVLLLDPGWIKIRIRDKHPGSATLTVAKTIKRLELAQLQQSQISCEKGEALVLDPERLFRSVSNQSKKFRVQTNPDPQY